MKMNFYFIWSCFTLFCLAMLMVSCSKEVETTEVLMPNVSLESTERTSCITCNQCPVDFCCCRIDIIAPNMDNADLLVCGNLFASLSCPPIDSCFVAAAGNCPEIRGALFLFEVEHNISFLYCQEEESAIHITNTETFTIRVRVTCMIDEITTMFTDLIIPGGESATVYVDGDCEPEECN